MQGPQILTQITKAQLLKDVPIFQETQQITAVYSENVALSRLYTHDILEISIVLDGEGIHQIFNQLIPCKRGDIFIIGPSTPHGYYLAEEGAALQVKKLYFDAKDWFEADIATASSARFCYGVFRDDPVTAYAVLNTETLTSIKTLCSEIEKEIDSARAEWREAVRAHLSMLLITVSRYVNGAIKISAAAEKEWSTVSPAIRIINEQFGDSELTLQTIADKLYISKSHLSRLFKRLMGQSFSEYLRSIRITHACTLLRESEYTVEEIVYHCGLRDLSNFYQVFNAQIGMTPKKYRQKYTGNTQEKGEKLMAIFSEISQNVQRGRAKLVKELVQQAIDEGSNPQEILDNGLLAGMSVVGEKFRNNEIFVPEVLIAARALNQGAEILKPYLMEAGITSRGKVCLGTVQGDLHDIGKNLVKMMLEGKGLEVVDLGVDVPTEKFISTAIEENCQIICCSSLLTTTMPAMAEVVKAAEAAGIRDKVKIMVGGAPVTEQFCKEIGADCYTDDAASAAEMAVQFCK